MDYVEHTGEMRNTYGVLAGKPEGKRPLPRPKHRWVDNLKMAPTKTVKGRGLDWSGSGQGQVSVCCKHCHELYVP